MKRSAWLACVSANSISRSSTKSATDLMFIPSIIQFREHRVCDKAHISWHQDFRPLTLQCAGMTEAPAAPGSAQTFCRSPRGPMAPLPLDRCTAMLLRHTDSLLVASLRPGRRPRQSSLHRVAHAVGPTRTPPRPAPRSPIHQRILRSHPQLPASLFRTRDHRTHRSRLLCARVFLGSLCLRLGSHEPSRMDRRRLSSR